MVGRKTQLPQADFPLFPVVSFVKFTRQIPMCKTLAFQKAVSILPSEFTGGMLILFQLDRRHPEFPAQVSGSFTPVVSGRLQLDSPRRCPVLTEITPLDNRSPLQRISAINSVGELDSFCSFTVWEHCQYLFISRPPCFFEICN